MQLPQSPVYRQLALPVPTFDYIKQFQRDHEARTGERLTIAAVVAAIVRDHQHQRSEARGVREDGRSQKAALLRRT